jgi:hypothetical protein
MTGTLSFRILAAASFLAATCVCGENLLRNGEFKISADGKSAPGWKINKELSSQSLRNSIEDGRPCLEILTTSATEKPGVLSQRVKLNPGKLYSFAIDAKRDSFVYGTEFRARFLSKGKYLNKNGDQIKTFRSVSWEPSVMIFPSDKADEAEIQIISPNTGSWRITKGRKLFLGAASLTEINHADDIRFGALKKGVSSLSADIKSGGAYYLWIRADTEKDAAYTLKTKDGSWTFQSYTPGKNRWTRPVLPGLLLDFGKAGLEFDAGTPAHEMILTMDPYYEPEGTDSFINPAPGCPASVPDMSQTVKNGKVELSCDTVLPEGRHGLTQGLPFPKGALRDASKVRADGRPLQTAALGKWPDGSVKWLQVSAFVKDREKLNLEYGEDITPGKAPESKLKAEKTAAGVVVDTGALRFEIPSDGSALMKNITGGKRVISEAVMTLNGSAPGSVPEITVEENGPVRAAVKISGKFSQNPDFSYLVRLFAYENTAELEMEHSLILSSGDKGTVEKCALELKTKADSSEFRPGSEWINVSHDASLTAAVKSPKSAVNDFPWILSSGGRTLSGKNAAGIVRISGGAPVILAVRDFWQNAPKAITVAADSLTLNLIDKEQIFWIGSAKTHSLALSFSGNPADAEFFLSRPLLIASPEWYCNSKAFHAWPLSAPEAAWDLYESSVKKTISFWEKRDAQSMSDPAFFNGMMFYGEVCQAAANRVTNNLETAIGEGLMVQYFRSMEKDRFIFAERALSHFVDASVNHSDNSSAGHVYVHCPAERTQTEHRANGHSWFNGSLMYGFFTASRRIIETGAMVGKYHADVLPEWSLYDNEHYWRKPAWQFMCIIQGWDASGDWTILQKAKKIAELTKAQRDHIVTLWPYMYSVGMKALREYYETTGDPQIRELYLQIMDGYMRLRAMPGDRCFGEHEKAPGMLLGNYPNDRSCCFYNETAQADWLSGLPRYAVPAGKDMTVQLEYGIIDPTFLWGSADLLRAMRQDNMPFPKESVMSPLVAMTPPADGTLPAAFKFPAVVFQLEKKTNEPVDISLFSRPAGKYSAEHTGVAALAGPGGKIISSLPVRTDGLRKYTLSIPAGAQDGIYTLAAALRDQWRWTVDDIRFPLKKGPHKLKLALKYNRLMVTAVSVSKPGAFNPFSGKASNDGDVVFLRAADWKIPAGFKRVDDISADGGAAVRLANATTSLEADFSAPEDGVYEFFAKVWKGAPDLIMLSVDDETPVKCAQTHDMGNDASNWMLSVSAPPEKCRIITGASETFKNMPALLFDGRGLKDSPAFTELGRFFESALKTRGTE